VILLDFWATWCPPCKAEIPGFVELQEAYRDKGLQVVGVSVDDTPDKLKPFASEFKMNYPVLVGLERDDLQDAYGPMWGIPTTYLIARDGRICRKNSGMVGKAQYESDIKGLL
jgi:thiol-disulfide isomerase/thioredoxin